MSDVDWAKWHEPYDTAGSSLDRRLDRVRQRIRDALDEQPAGPVRVISMCAGQGRDLLGVLPAHPRRSDVVARLVELDPRNVEHARRSAADTGLRGVEVVEGDASLGSAYLGLVPSDLVLVCGVFGNVSDEHIRHTVASLPRFCRTGGTVIWTRHREPPDLTPVIRDWFRDNGFTEIGFDFEAGFTYGVGAHRLTAPSLPYLPELRLFDFVGDGGEAHR
ncbi:MAG TPA: class I SAM-dependent methyltransferase family protein [Pseudonocardiaceae bacterium]|nr:class I SAM-dependent methyltransferase family protein [Pseudonocardiaceae bacterium]